MVGIEQTQIHRRKSCLPVVCMDDIGFEFQRNQQGKCGVVEKREACEIVLVVVAIFAVKTGPVKERVIHEIKIEPVSSWRFPDFERFGSTSDLNANTRFKFNQIRFLFTDATVQRRNCDDLMAELYQCGRQGSRHVAETAGF